MGSDTVRRTPEEAAKLGHPSYVWREGQERRLRLIRQWAKTEGARILVDGCGIGMYIHALQRYTPHVYGLDIDAKVLRVAGESLSLLCQAAGEALPFPDDTFDTVLSHEVIEHVMDDRQTVAEMVRVLKPGGRIVLFCPNRFYPFETHGHFWRGKYHFGNTPLINYLPDVLRNRLAPHVRAYTPWGLRDLFRDLPVRVVYHTQIFPGYDNIIARSPRLGRFVRGVTYALERTPLRILGLSHFLVVEKEGREE
ncbi:MAG: class I SAM-dependent methyltransferase [Chloroflexi bacterium]|nr:class I SAM-dependent methyltransferase [Chloroflexota bacterium]